METMEGHDVWSDMVQGIHQQYSQQYSQQLEGWRQSAAVEHENALQQQTRTYDEQWSLREEKFLTEIESWKQKVAQVEHDWKEDVSKKIAIEKDNAQYQLTTVKEIHRDQVNRFNNEVGEMRKVISSLEMEILRHQRQEGNEDNRPSEAVTLLRQQIVEMDVEKDELLQKIDTLQTVVEEKNFEIQKWKKMASELTNQPLYHPKSMDLENQHEYVPLSLSRAAEKKPIQQSNDAELEHSDGEDSSDTVIRVDQGQPSRLTTVRVNASSAEVSGQQKSRHKTPFFDGTGSVTARDWLRQFEKLIEYHQWDSHTALAEFKISMTGAADTWFCNLSRAVQNNLDSVVMAFEKNYGGTALEKSKAINTLSKLKQGKESMETFAPKVRSLIYTVIPGDDPASFQHQMSYFLPTLDHQLATMVVAARTSTFSEAVDVAIETERGLSFLQNAKQNRNQAAPTIGPTLPTHSKDDTVEAMDLNAQRFHSSKSQKPKTEDKEKTSKKCLFCQKPGHLYKQRFLLKKIKDETNTKKSEYRSNVQQVKVETGTESGIEISNKELDLTTNLFHQLGGYSQNMQESVDRYIPVVKGGTGHPDTSFVVEIFVNKEEKSEALMDTGAMITTISRKEANRLGLELQPAPPLRITYGNESSGMSTATTVFSCVVNGVEYGEHAARVVDRQNIDCIFGMDWLLSMDVLLDPREKALVARDTINLSYSINTMITKIATMITGDEFATIPKEVVELLVTMSTLYDESEPHTITNAPVKHSIDTGDARPIVRHRRRFSPKEENVINEIIQSLLEKKVLQTSTSSWCSTSLVVPNPDGTQTDLEVAQANDEYIIKIKEQQPMQQKFFMKHNILCFNNGDNPVVVIPASLQPQFLKSIHDHPTSGHLGRDKMIHKAKENGWWSTMNKDVTEYVKQCMKCKMHKTPTHKYRKLTSIEVGAPGEMWAADIAFLSLSKRNNRYLLVCMDYLTKWVVTAALPSLDADSVANVLLYSVILVFGHVSKFLTDNGTNFIAEALQMICKRLGIKKIQTSVEHPQTDGLVERMNRTIKSALAIYCEENSTDWDIYLPFVTFAINTSKQASTGETPFKAMFGRKAHLPSLQEIADLKITTYTTKAWLDHLNHYIPILHNDIRANIQRSQQAQQHYYNKGRKEKAVQVDDVVLKIKMKKTLGSFLNQSLLDLGKLLK